MSTEVVVEQRPEVAEYLTRVEALFGDVERWLVDLEPSDHFRRTAVELAEQRFGTYKAQSLEVVRGDVGPLHFVPRGRDMLGAFGRVDVRGVLGSEMLVWVAAGGPAVGFSFSDGSPTAEVVGRSMFPGVPQGWAWVDQSRATLVHLDADVFRSRVLESLS